MFPIVSEGGSISAASQQQQQTMRSGDYSAYALPTGSVFTAVPSPPQQQQQHTQRAFLNNNSVLIDPPTTFFVQAQQQQQQQPQKVHTMLSYSHNPSANSSMAAFQSPQTTSMPFFATANGAESSAFGSGVPLSALNPAARTQRMGSVLNSVASMPQQQQQQQQRMQSVYLQSNNASFVAPPYQQQQQRGNSVSINSAQYSPFSHQSQPPVLSATPPGSTRGQLSGTPQLLSSQQPLSPLSSSGMLQPSYSGGGHHTTTSTPSVAFSSPPTSVLQHPQQLVTGMGSAVVDPVNTLGAANATGVHSHTAAAAAVASHGVDAEEARQANERPFRFKMLPPPPTFDRFLQQWEANAADSNYRPWRRGDGGAGHVDAADHLCVLTAEDVLQRTAAAATATVVASAAAGGGGNGGGGLRSVQDRLALAEQYHRILERWWYYMSVFEQKAEVRQRLGSLYSCPDYADAQRAVATGFAEPLSGEPREQLTQEELTLQTWSQLVLKWWEETKRRRRTRRSRRGSRKDGTSTSSAAGRSTLDDSPVMDGEATPPQLENDEAASEASGQSLHMAHYQSGRRTRSLTDNEGYLNFDFTNQTPFGSLADSS